MSKTGNISKERHNEILALKEQGYNNAQIAEMTGISLACVAKHTNGTINPNLYYKMMCEVYHLRSKGEKIKDIADMQNVSTGAVSYRIKTFKRKYLCK